MGSGSVSVDVFGMRCPRIVAAPGRQEHQDAAGRSPFCAVAHVLRVVRKGFDWSERRLSGEVDREQGMAANRLSYVPSGATLPRSLWRIVLSLHSGAASERERRMRRRWKIRSLQAGTGAMAWQETRTMNGPAKMLLESWFVVKGVARVCPWS